MNIEMNGTPTGTKIFDDFGKPIDGVCELDIRHRAGGLPEVVLSLNLVKVAVCGNIEPRYYLAGYGYLKSVELEDGTKIDLQKPAITEL